MPRALYFQLKSCSASRSSPQPVQIFFMARLASFRNVCGSKPRSLTAFHNYIQFNFRKSSFRQLKSILCCKLSEWYNGQNCLGVDVMPDQQLTVEEVAEELRVHPETVRQWIREGELDAFDTGRGYRISRADLDDFMQR